MTVHTPYQPPAPVGTRFDGGETHESGAARPARDDRGAPRRGGMNTAPASSTDLPTVSTPADISRLLESAGPDEPFSGEVDPIVRGGQGRTGEDVAAAGYIVLGLVIAGAIFVAGWSLAVLLGAAGVGVGAAS